MPRLAAPRALLFDLDGTLVDSIADLAASANHTREHYHLPTIEVAMVASYVGDGARWLLRRTLEDLGDRLDLDEALNVFRNHYLDHCLDRTKPYPGVVTALRALDRLPLAVVTNKPGPMAEKIVDGLGLRPPVRAVVGARRGIPVKPDPGLLRLALAELELDALSGPSVWMIGDSRNDVLAGKEIGATTLVVPHGLGDLDELRELGVDVVLGDVSELPSLVHETTT